MPQSSDPSVKSIVVFQIFMVFAGLEPILALLNSWFSTSTYYFRELIWGDLIFTSKMNVILYV